MSVMDQAVIEFRPGHVCEVMYTANDEIVELRCECSPDPVFVFKYPPSPRVDVTRPGIDAIRLAVADHYAKLGDA
jgi:hypothetical protein